MEEQNFELKELMEYNSAEEFFDSDSEGTNSKSDESCEDSSSETSEISETSGTNSSEITIYVGKTFQSWDYVEKFMKRYASIKGHGVRIGGGGRVDKENNQILKRTYLCRHAGESKGATSCRVGCPWKLNIWAKKDRNCLEVTTFKDQHVGHELSPLASRFVPTLRKLSKEILQEIRFLTVVAKVNATVQYRIIREKFKTRIYRTDLYNAIDKFRREATPGEEDAGTLLKRLYDKKDEDPRWIITMKLDSATGSLTHLFWMTPEQQILWLRYHDVIMHDNTCKTNRYNRPLSLFVTTDNNLKTRIVAQAIVDDESQFSYEWIFQCVKEATGFAPKVFVTDGDPAVNAAVTIQFPNTFHMHCIWHISQNLPKQLKGKLGSSFDDFMKDFYKARNSLTERQFYERWDALSQNYPESKDYLNRSLGQNPQSWARAFTNKYFTAGVQSTSRSESENSTLKRLFGNSSLSLCELFDALEERYQEENDYCDFVNWKQSVPRIGPKNVVRSIFGPVVKQLTEFVPPNIIKKQEEQMDLSLCYHAVQIVLENAHSREEEFVESEQFIDNLFDCPQAQLNSFLADISQILEVWEVNHLVHPNTSHFICLLDNGTFLCTCMAFKTLGYPCRHFYRVLTLTSTARFHIGLINNRWYKESLQERNISSYEFVVISNLPSKENHILPSQFSRPDSIDVIQPESSRVGDIEVSKVISKKRKFGELFGLGRKIITDVIEDGDEEAYNEVLEFLQSIQQRRQRILCDSNVNVNIVGIQNPVARTQKGRPKLKRTKGALEESSNKSQYKCKTCKQMGHNSKTCKGKGKENQDDGEMN